MRGAAGTSAGTLTAPAAADRLISFDTGQPAAAVTSPPAPVTSAEEDDLLLELGGEETRDAGDSGPTLSGQAAHTGLRGSDRQCGYSEAGSCAAGRSSHGCLSRTMSQSGMK